MESDARRPQSGPFGDAEEALSAFLSRLEAGEDIDLDRFCAEHPGFESAMRALENDAESSEAPSFRKMLRELLEREVRDDYGQTRLQPLEEGGGATALSSGRRPDTASPRYAFRDEIARGGMGIVLRVWDQDLQRPLAMKVLDRERDEGTSSRPDRLLRFLEEAQITAQLDHPGIVPVHEVGFRDDRRLYFTMRLVRGRDLKEVFDLAREEKEGWNIPRAVGVMVRVCQAVAYAHAKGVVHRDLKPANVMVGHFGEVYVMDWGLAKIVGKRDLHDLRPREDPGSPTAVGSVPDDTGGESPDGPVVTMDGTVLGTPAYMSPEQARGDVDEVDARSDVYSLGAMLYTLLTGQLPYVSAGARVSSRELLGLVIQGPPTPIRELDRRAPDELVAICEKAMARSRSSRYGDCLELADDLQAHLERRVVRAHETGAAAEFRKWILRNRGLTAAIATAVVIAVSALLVVTILQAFANRRLTEANESSERLLVDTHTSQGLTASDRGEAAEAVLWFANAAYRARGHPEREHFNRVRVSGWRRKLSEPVRAFQHEGDWPKELSFHASGRYLMALSYGNRCAIWDIVEATRYPLPLVGDISFAAWSPSGELIAVGTPGGRVHVFGFPDAQLRERIEHHGVIYSLSFSENGRYLAIASDAVRVWDFDSRAFLDPELPHPEAVLELTFNPRGDLLATACADQTASVFALSRGRLERRLKPVPHRTPMARRRPFKPLFVGGGRSVLTLEDKAVLSLWNVDSGQRTHTVRVPKELEVIRNVALTADGRHIAVAGFGGTQVWDVRERGTAGPLLGSLNWVDAVAVSPDGRTLVSGGADNMVWLASVPDVTLVCPPIRHLAAVQLAAFSPGARLFATFQEDGLVRVWRYPDPSGCIQTVPLPNARETLLAVSRDGNYVMPASWNLRRSFRTTRVYEFGSGRVLGAELQADGFINGGAFSPDGRHVVTLSAAPTVGSREQRTEVRLHRDRGRVQFWDWHSGEEVAPALETPSEPVGVDYHPDGEVTVILCGGGDLFLVESAGGQTAGRTKLPGRLQPGLLIRDCVRFSPDGERILAWGVGGGVHVLDAETLAPKHDPLEERLLFRHLRFAPDGRHFVCVASGGTVFVRDLSTGQQSAAPIEHRNWVFTARFSSDSRLVATACRDRLAYVWDWQSGELVCPPMEHRDEVFDVLFSPDDRTLVTASRDDTVRLWEVLTGNPLAPPIELGGWVYQVEGPREGRIVAAGLMRSISFIELSDVLGSDATGMDSESLRTFGEIVSSQRIHEGRGVVNLSSAEWLARWTTFRKAYPSFHDLDTSDETRFAWHQRTRKRYETGGSWSAAIWHTTRCIELRPTDRTLYTKRGELALRLGRWSEAVSDYSRAIDLAPASWRDFYLRATACAMLGRWDEAVADCREAVARFEDAGDLLSSAQCAAALLAGEVETYREACERALERIGEPRTARAANTIAWRCSLGPGAVENIDGVVALGRFAVTRVPGSPSYRNTFGACLYRAGKSKEAIEQLQRVVDGFPSQEPQTALGGCVMDWLFLAMAHYELGEVERARELLGVAKDWLDEVRGDPAGVRLYTRRLSPYDWLQIAVLRREAEKLVSGAARRGPR